MSDLYAWAPISHKNTDGSDASLKAGDKVTADFLKGIDDVTVKVWKHDGILRSDPFPKNIPLTTSVRNHLLRKLNEDFEKAQQIGSPMSLTEAPAQAVVAELNTPAATTPAPDATITS